MDNESPKDIELILAFSQIEDAVVVYDRELRYTYINSIGASLLGEEPDRIIGKSNRDLIGEGADTMEPHIRRAFDTKEKVFVLHEIPLADGNRIFDTVYTPVKDDQGQVARVVGICRDVTQEKNRLQYLHDLAEIENQRTQPNLISAQGYSGIHGRRYPCGGREREHPRLQSEAPDNMWVIGKDA